MILDSQGNFWTHTISLESFRSFRGPLFRKPVTDQELFLLFLQQTGSNQNWFCNAMFVSINKDVKSKYKDIENWMKQWNYKNWCRYHVRIVHYRNLTSHGFNHTLQRGDCFTFEIFLECLTDKNCRGIRWLMWPHLLQSPSIFSKHTAELYSTPPKALLTLLRITILFISHKGCFLILAIFHMWLSLT